MPDLTTLDPQSSHQSIDRFATYQPQIIYINTSTGAPLARRSGPPPSRKIIERAMTPTAAAAPSLLLGLLVASARPLTPCLAWVRQPSLLLLPHDHRRSPLGGSSSSCTGMLGQQQRWHWSLAAGAVGSSGGSVGDGDGIAAAAAAAAAVASKPTRRRRSSTASSDGDDALAAGGAAAEKKAAARKKKPAAAASTTKAKPKAAKPAKPVFEPHPRWREQLNGIRRMREEGPEAPVDWAGCSELGLRNATSERHARFQTLISSMMSSQTTDIVNEGAMRRLHEACGITIEGLEALGEEGIVAVIKPVSFYTPKAQNMLKVCAILKEKYDGDIPRTFEDLMEMPGIGPKMATLIMEYAWGVTVGITVDTHVHRISNRLGWADTWNHKNPKAQTPEKTRKLLESWLPKEHWKEVNPLMVGLGQTVCRAIGPKCHECAITHLCPSYIPPEACL